MKGDFSRLNLFDPLTQYTRVLQQQGRVQLDADWNEQGDILLHYLRTLARDLIGPFGSPDDGFGVGITGDGDASDLTVGAGRYYVDGLLCENRLAVDSKGFSYLGQPHPDPFPKTFPMLVYLDVWERHVTFHQDGALREVALGGADTTSRAQVVWRVRTAPLSALTNDTTVTKKTVWKGWEEWQKTWQSPDRGRLKAQADRGGDDTDPCTASPEARYRRTENQLYRVEVQGWDADARALTFKWSRENGSVVFAVQELQGDVATLASLGRDDASGLKEKDWVEIVDDGSELAGLPGALRQVKAIDPSRRTVTLVPAAWEPRPPVYTEEGEALAKRALLRRWDHRASPQPKDGAGAPAPNGAALFVFPADATQELAWVTLENGIRIQFQRGSFRPGDYWLIPARTATGDVEWPGPPETPAALLPHGVEHHYAPLALVGREGVTLKLQQDLRGSFAPLAK
jgi:hypothetical protein